MLNSFNTERRVLADRRVRDSGPPPSCGERRHILMRRMLNLGHTSFDDWLGRPVGKPGKPQR